MADLLDLLEDYELDFVARGTVRFIPTEELDQAKAA